MRVKEPLNGFLRSMGHVIFHIVLLAGTFVVQIGRKRPEPSGMEWAGFDKWTEDAKNIDRIMNITRWVHGIIIVAKMLRTYLTPNPANRMIIRIIRVLSNLTYLIFFLYLQYWLTMNIPEWGEPRYTLYGKYFMLIEVITFYGQIFNMVLFLIFVTLRGQFGYKDYQANKDRFKFDAIQYYKDDIQWLSFQTVPIVWKLNSFVDRTRTHPENTIHQILLWVLIGLNVMAIFLLQPCRTQFRKLRIHSWKAWGTIYVGLIAGWIVKLIVEPYWDKTFFLLVGDTLLFSLQCLLYYVSLDAQENPNGKSILKSKFIHLLIGFVPQEHGPKSKTDTKTFEDEPLVIQGDSYSLAFAALIHPEAAAKVKKSDAHLPVIKMSNDEREQIFTSAIMITMFQIIYLSLFGNLFKGGTHIQKTDNFIIMIPRVLSCFMMHMVVVPDLRQGLRLMKFAIKHPWFFRVIEDEPEDPNEVAEQNLKKDPSNLLDEEEVDQETGMLRRVFCAFMLGFFQFVIACIAQVIIILILFQQNDVVNVLVKFASLCGVTKFDDFYAATLTENPIKKAQGKKIEFQFLRKMSEVHPDDYDKYKEFKKAKKETSTDVQKEDAMRESMKGSKKQDIKSAMLPDAENVNAITIRNVQGNQLVKDPKYESWLLLLLFLIFKLFRVYFVSWGYYFTPVYALILNFYFNFAWS